MENSNDIPRSEIDWSVIEGFFRGLKPTERASVWEWADKYRVLTAESSPEPGQWRTSRVPYAREIMDNLSASASYKEIIVMKGAQLAFTEIGLNWIGYCIDIDPAPMLIVMGTEDALRKNTKTRIDPLIKNSETLAAKVPQTRASGNNMFEKQFEGGILMMAGANSATGLRSMPIRFLMLDEVDSYPNDLDGEGSPVSLAEARASNFPNKKIYKISTPSIKGESLIELEYENTDKRKYHVPCPHCGTMQTLEWEGIGWEMGKGGKPSKVWYECSGCHAHIEERHKTKMLAAGEWVATAPQNSNPDKVGYHISSLYSPYGWYSWSDLVVDYHKGLENETKLKTFFNLRLGLPFAVKGEAPKWELLRERAEPYAPNRPPLGCVFLTAGVDVQRDRIELEIVGWGRNRESWSIDFRTIMGDPAEQDVWDKLQRVVFETWEREDGLVMPLMKMAVDSGDSTTHVYNFVRRFDGERVIAVKGTDNKQVVWSRPNKVDVSKEGIVVGTVQLFSIGVGVLKSELYSLLRLHRNEDGTAPYGYCHFPDSYPTEWFKGIASEQLQQVTTKKGYTTSQWVKTYRRNEPLDCRNYARAAASIMLYDNYREQDFQMLEGTYSRKTQQKETTAAAKKKSDYWD